MDSFILSLVVTLLQIHSTLTQTITVSTSLGDVTGLVRSNNNVQFNAFFGIPFAKPPTGNRRFQPPQPAEAWAPTTLEAFDPKPYCPQVATDASVYRSMQSEDCLYLTIYVSGDLLDPVLLPVMLFIHGGRSVEGGAAEHNGIALATDSGSDPVVVVVIQYRLGYLGFASSGDERVPGNMGLRDQVLAMEWVRDNIAAFNGDKDRVTIFGNSAGAANVVLHLLSPMTDGLFQRAIIQSAGPVWTLPERESLKDTFEQSAVAFGCNPDAAESIFQTCLQNVPVETIVNSPFNEGFNLGVIDGAYLLDQPNHLFETGQFHDVDVIVGFNSEDGDVVGNLFSAGTDERGAFTDPVIVQTVLGYSLAFYLNREVNNGDGNGESSSEESDDGNGNWGGGSTENEAGWTRSETGSGSDGGSGGSPNAGPLDEAARLEFLLNTFIAQYGPQGLDIPGVDNMGQLMDMLTGKYAGFGNAIQNTRGALDSLRDSTFLAFAVFVANAMSTHGANVWVYELDHRTSYLSQPGPGDVPLGMPHEGEMEYVFGYGWLEDGPSFVTGEEKHLSRSMMKAWTGFAKDGNPSFLATDSSEIAWPQYNIWTFDTNPQYVKFTTTMDSESIGGMAYDWWPTTNFWNSIDALAYPEEDGEGSEEDIDSSDSSEEYKSNVLKLDSFEADLTIILLSVAVFILLISTCTLCCMVCSRRNTAEKYLT